MPAPDHLTGLRFDSVAEHYHQLRPRYPDAIWDALFDITGLSPGARVLEIGAGTGIATAELVHRGLHVTALEPGPDWRRSSNVTWALPARSRSWSAASTTGSGMASLSTS